MNERYLEEAPGIHLATWCYCVWAASAGDMEEEEASTVSWRPVLESRGELESYKMALGGHMSVLRFTVGLGDARGEIRISVHTHT